MRVYGPNSTVEVCVRFETAGESSNEDRETIIQIARKKLAHFQPKPEPE
jgi:hypothetical protein